MTETLVVEEKKTKEKKELDVRKQLIKDYGEIFVDGVDILEEEQKIIKISPQLDIALGGGIPEGSFVTLSGQAKLGKTSLALHIAARAQQQLGSEVYYLNIEGRLKQRDVVGFPYLNKEKFCKITSTQGNILQAHHFLTIAEKLIHTKPNSVIILDSYSCLCTEAEMTSDMDKMQRADGPKLLAKFMRKVAGVVPINNNIVIGINHLMANVTGYGAAWKEKGGQAVAYQSDVKLRAIKATPIMDTPGETGTQIGQEITWHIITSAIGPPGAKTSTHLVYGRGMDEIREIVNLAESFGLINKKASWYKLTFLGSDDSVQGLYNVFNRLESNPEEYKMLCDKVKEFTG